MLGMESMTFFAVKVLPVVVVTATWDLLFSMEATGEERWILAWPMRLAMPLATDCVPSVR